MQTLKIELELELPFSRKHYPEEWTIPQIIEYEKENIDLQFWADSMQIQNVSIVEIDNDRKTI
jgi:hypothetical protein